MYKTEIIWKIAPRGGGKTKWLAKKALLEQDAGNEIYLYTGNNYPIYDLQYRKFMELFYANFERIATIHATSSLNTIPEGSVVLFDDILHYPFNPAEIPQLIGKVKKIYITAEGNEEHDCSCKGKCHDHTESVKNSNSSTQLSIFDLHKEEEVFSHDKG